jgi:hypothetical protein
MDRTGNTASNSSYIVSCVFVAAGTCLPSRCLATLEGGHTNSNVISLASVYFYTSHQGLQLIYEIFFPLDFCTLGLVAAMDKRTQTIAHHVSITTTGQVKAGIEPLPKRHA